MALALPAGAKVVKTTGEGYQGVRHDDEAKADVAVWKIASMPAAAQQTLTVTLAQSGAAAARPDHVGHAGGEGRPGGGLRLFGDRRPRPRRRIIHRSQGGDSNRVWLFFREGKNQTRFRFERVFLVPRLSTLLVARVSTLLVARE